MAEASRPGRLMWTELRTSDLKAAEAFYIGPNCKDPQRAGFLLHARQGE